ncbi:MAG TPA: IPT/TIG domain-containing protein, partial [Verrucomicrobiae bacterium]|nr:IPT/TIG domain-containing protein [Verrucomicrobiae bacterium]
MLRLNANGFGSFPTASATGHAFATGDVTQQQNITNAIYTISSDGLGTAGFGTSSSLFSGGHDIFVSADGNYLIGLATVAGNRQIFVATKEFSTSTNDSRFQGNYWIVELIAEVGRNEYTTATGAVRGDGAGNISLSERTRTHRGVFDLGGLNQYALDADGTGFFGPFFDPDVTNFAVGVPGGASPRAFVGAQIGGRGDVSAIHGIYFGVRFPDLNGPGTFLNPHGILNSASFAPPTFPISGGTIVALFGSELASGTEAAQSTPLPTSMRGTSVTVNGVLAPLFFVSPGQINIQVPFATSGGSANIVVNRGGSNSNTVATPVAPSSPGVFTQNVTGIGPGVITHLDFSLVTPQNPAAPGETVIMYLTGMGALNPPVADGAPGPSNPLSETTDPEIGVSFGGESGTILFSGAAPFFVGLYQ